MDKQTTTQLPGARRAGLVVAVFGMIAILATVLQSHRAIAAAKYLLAPGDQIEISVVGIPELQRRMFVETDGTISFPMLGTLKVAGLSLPEARAGIKSKLALKVYTRATVEAGEQKVVIGFDDITVVMADYRPISVKGAVARAGQFAYRPLITVREAVALSGGYALAPAVDGRPATAAVDFRSDYESHWLDIVKQQTAIWRLNAELSNKKLDPKLIENQVPDYAPISKETVTKIVGLAQDQFKTRQDETVRRREYLERTIGQMKTQIKTVTRQEARFAAAVENDAEELKQLEVMLKKGTVVRRRVVDARRNLLNSETRRLESSAELSRLAQMLGDLQQQLSRLADEQKIRTLQELETATVRLDEARSRLQSATEKLQIAAAPTQLAAAELLKPVITLHRNLQSRWQTQVVDESFELLPGDIIEIKLGK